MENTGCYHGGMVAFEGPFDIVSTQLRLLPPSSQVLILPDLEHYMKKEDDQNFAIRPYVKEVHEAAQARYEIALQFLGESSRGNKRLVFLNGGTAGAVSQCIAAISHHKTSGDSLHAEMILREVLREGVQGLDHEQKDCDELVPGAASVCTRDEYPWDDEEVEEDPIIKAMKAADALYKETESLEPIECYIRTRPRSMSYPMPGWADCVGQASPFFIFGPPPNEDDQHEPSAEGEGPPENSHNSSKRCTTWASTPSSGMMIPLAYRPSSPIGRSYKTRSVASRTHIRNRSSTSNAVLSPPMSPSEVEFGEARLVPMQASRKEAKALRRTRSLDEMELHRARMRRRVVSSMSPVPEVASPPMSPADVKTPCRHLSIMEDPFSNNNLIRLPRAKFVRANTTTIRKSPTFAKPPYSMAGTHCTDRDTKSEAEHGNKEDHLEVAARDLVLPFHEDLVIQFTGEVSNHILDSVIESLQSGLYPVSTLPLDWDGTADTESCPSTPRTADLFDMDHFHGGLPPVAEVPSVDESVAGDCDAYSTSGLSRASNFGGRFHSPCPSLPPEVQPPTPAHTPPILLGGIVGIGGDGSCGGGGGAGSGGAGGDARRAQRFQVVSTIDRVNAIAIQNNLRCILDAHFPPEQDRRYRVSSRFSLLPQMDKIWRPLFWNPGSKGRAPGERTADLILAIGAQNSVKAEFVSALTGQIEKLGSKSTGMTRSGRLDLRFLVANAMQSFTTQSLANQLQENPFDSPHLLACLTAPHLATYLSVNASIRFLILEYPAEHLATVVALQNLIGVDLLKIAGIIDSEAASAYNTEPGSPVSISSLHYDRERDRDRGAWGGGGGSFSSGSRLSAASATTSSSAAAAVSQLARSLDAISLPGSPFALLPHPPLPLPLPLPLQSPFGAGPGSSSITLGQRRRLSFSKANYVLTNTATESEIAGFISMVWKILIQADPFYAPDPRHNRSSSGSNRTTMSAVASRYPTTNLSNGSLVSSGKFAPSTPPPATTTNGAASSSSSSPAVNHQGGSGGYPHWGIGSGTPSPATASEAAAALVSPPSSRGGDGVSVAGEHQHHQQQHDYPVPPPPSIPVPLPPPLSSSLSTGGSFLSPSPASTWPNTTTTTTATTPTTTRDASPSGASFRSVRSRGRNNTTSTTTMAAVGGTTTTGGNNSYQSHQNYHRSFLHHHNTHTSSSSSPSRSLGGGSTKTGNGAAAASPAAAAYIGSGGNANGGGGGGGGFSLRSKSLNRILASRRGRKASGGTTSSTNPNNPPSPSTYGDGDTIETTTTTPTPPPFPTGDFPVLDSNNSLLYNNNNGSNDATSAYAVSLVDEGEFYDDEERRLMPMYMRQREIRKGNSRKALKWLGLA